LSGRFGSAAYAMEELVSEIGAAFQMARLELSAKPRPEHAAYISHWIQVLKEDNRAIFVAAAKAQQAVDWIFREHELKQQKEENAASEVKPEPAVTAENLTRPESIELYAAVPEKGEASCSPMQAPTRYVGTRTEGGCEVVKVTEGQDPKLLDPRLDLINHSPRGFDWGYEGSGPAQTALAILADATRDDRTAAALHQDFKRNFIARADVEGFEISAAQIQQWVSERRRMFGLAEGSVAERQEARQETAVPMTAGNTGSEQDRSKETWPEYADRYTSWLASFPEPSTAAAENAKTYVVQVEETVRFWQQVEVKATNVEGNCLAGPAWEKPGFSRHERTICGG
jgi:septum formation inhibitor MinC